MATAEAGAAERGRPTVVSWSSGKDSAWTLATLRAAPEYRVVGLLTTVTAPFDRVAIHGVRRRLLAAQAAALGLPLHEIELPYPCTNAEYEARMAPAVAALRAAGVRHVAFGDLYLDDVRRYREERMRGTGLAPIFPLWGRPTGALARSMVAGGLRATLSVVDPKRLPARFAGRAFDAALLDELPAGVDPCGENGEFHTFVTDAPGFARPVPVRVGPTVARDGFVFADLVPEGSGASP